MTTKGALTASVFFLPILLLCRQAGADYPELPQSPPLSGRVTGSYPLASLPEHVAAPDGRLTLFADFDDVDDTYGQYVAVYLVNRTDKRIGFFSQDYDIYVKLEALTDSGEWERAQPHYSSSCGNSYDMTPSLKPGTFFKFGGYYPAEGEPRIVRYRLYHRHALVVDDDAPEDEHRLRRNGKKIPIHLVSNSGTGRVSLQTIAATRTDSMAIGFGNFTTVRDIALGTVKKPPNSWAPLSRLGAVLALHRFATPEALALLEELMDDSDRGISEAAVAAVALMGLEFPPAEERFQQLLQSEKPDIRAAAVWALKERPITPEVLGYAQELLADDDLWIRVAAMGVLGSQCKEDPEMRALISRLNRSTDPKIRSVFETTLLPTCINYSEPGTIQPP